jgi:NAD(P)H-dependent FMN reductase
MALSLTDIDPTVGASDAGTRARILVIAVSNRLDSSTRNLARLAEETTRGMWVDVSIVDSGDYPLPLCDCDLNENEGKAPPANALRLNKLIHEHQGIIIVTPERNRSIPAVLKNALDWLVVPAVNQDAALPFRSKPVVLMGASGQANGTFHSLNHLRDILVGLKMHVLPDVLVVNDAEKIFGKSGRTKDALLRGQVTSLVEELVLLTERLLV